MTDSDAEMIASLKGFTPGPWERDGICVSQMSRRLTEICLMGNPPQYPGDVGGMMVNSMHNAALIAAAPDLHRIATEQAAEIERLTCEVIDCTAELIYLRKNGKDGALWSANHSKDVWRDLARKALAAKP